jgi:hypothetical protein
MRSSEMLRIAYTRPAPAIGVGRRRAPKPRRWPFPSFRRTRHGPVSCTVHAALKPVMTFDLEIAFHSRDRSIHR